MSCHPEDAGVQLPLMDLLIRYGAVIDDPDGGTAVSGCLHNGRGEAAEFSLATAPALIWKGRQAWAGWTRSCRPLVCIYEEICVGNPWHHFSLT